MTDHGQSRLLLLAPEIRLLIYKHLLVATTIPAPASKDYVLKDDCQQYCSDSKRTLSIRHATPQQLVSLSKNGRSTYKIRAGPFRNICADATYVCVNIPDICTNILRVCRQIHLETAHILYSTYNFDFGTDVEACAPFLSHLTPFSRTRIQRLSVVKRALAYDKDFDRDEWKIMCDYISSNLSISHLSLGIVAGQPAGGWEGIDTIGKDEFILMSRRKVENMCWAEQLGVIKSLKRLDIRAYVEHCARPATELMAFFVAFSASIDSGFLSYLADMLTPNCHVDMASPALSH